MDEEELWTPADDENIRSVLDTLRQETQALPLADVRFIKARGNSRRRRSFVMGAAATAATVAVGVAGFNAFGSDQAPDMSPAAPSVSAPNTTATATPADPALPTDMLPTSPDWRRALKITGTLVIPDSRLGEDIFSQYCPVPPPGKPLKTSAVKAPPNGPDSAQAVYAASSADAGNAAAAATVSALVGCQAQKVTVEAGDTWPKVFSSHSAYNHTWYVVAHQGYQTTLIVVNNIDGSATPIRPLAQVQALALIAQQRLVQRADYLGLPSASTGR
jgi:hypothetical protein